MVPFIDTVNDYLLIITLGSLEGLKELPVYPPLYQILFPADP